MRLMEEAGLIEGCLRMGSPMTGHLKVEQRARDCKIATVRACLGRQIGLSS